MTPLEKCIEAAKNQGKTWDSSKSFAEMGLDFAAFHADVVAFNGEEPEPPVDPIELNYISGQDYIDAFWFTAGGGL